jgi:hypothetical protein
VLNGMVWQGGVKRNDDGVVQRDWEWRQPRDCERGVLEAAEVEAAGSWEPGSG